MDCAMRAKPTFLYLPNCLGIFSPFHVDTFFLPIERMISRTMVPSLWSVRAEHSGDQMIKFIQQGVGMSKASASATRLS